ncbi:MAG: hypothetical protein DRJ38_05805 [Thermoprotei archaeon]|nr:MAG: hypothetical protein DRJ38_05805 [Thermoprotei archaeon]
MAKIALPPSHLASCLVSTLLVHIAARFDRVIDVRREASGFLTVHIDADPIDLAQMIITSLRSRELRPEGISGALPLILGTKPGTDGKTLTELLKTVGILKPSLKAEKRIEIYDSLLRFLESAGARLVNELSTLRTSLSRGVLKIELGGDHCPVPVVIKSEAFYEIGRFSGVSDRRKKQRPKIGRVDYRASLPIAALLYDLLLALQTGYVAGVTNEYMFTAIQLEPGKVTPLQAKLVDGLYLELVRDVRRAGLRTWSQDYEGLRLASILRLIELYEYLKRDLRAEIPVNVLFNHIIIASTGRRFFPLWSVGFSMSELDTTTRIVESFSKELDVDTVRVLRLMRVLIVSSLRIASRTATSSAAELWHGVRAMVYSFTEGKKPELLDTTYRMLRLLSDMRTGLRNELLNSMASYAQDLGTTLENLVKELTLEPAENAKTALWRSLKKLVSLITA